MSTPPRGPRLRIVCINDVYTLENLPRLRTLVQHHLTHDPADAFVSTLAGDFVAPSMLSSLDSGLGMVDCMNAMPITHVCFGNHEDDIATDELRARIAEFKGTWLNTNLPAFVPSLPSHDVITVGRPGKRTVRVGVLGVVMNDATVYRRPPFGGAPMNPPNESALREATRLMLEEGCACVIPLTHQPMASDRALAHAVQTPPFPVIVGGHEHLVFLEQIGTTWIVKAGADAVNAVVLDLEWSVEGPAVGVADLPRVTVRLEPVANYEEDAGLRARVDGHMRAVHELEVATLFTLAPGRVLSSVGSRARQTTLGTLLCSTLRDALGADGCVFNGGGIRASHAYRDRFTYGDLKAELPFDNEVVVAHVPGRVLREAVAASRTLAPQESGGYLQVDDAMAVDEPSHTLTTVAGGPLVETREYRIALVRSFFLGMDHIEPFVRFAHEHPAKVPPPGCGREAKLVLVDAFSLALWRQLGGFDAVDANHDGTIQEAELADAVARATANPASPVTVSLVMSAVDRDHDHRISRDEATAATQVHPSRTESDPE